MLSADTPPAFHVDFDSGIAQDLSSHLHARTIENNYQIVDSELGKSLRPQGPSGHVGFDASGALLGNEDFSIGVSFKKDFAEASGRIFNFAKTTDIKVGEDSLVLRFFTGANEQRRLIPVGVGIADTDWHHIVLVYSQSSATLRLYVDGSVVGIAGGFQGAQSESQRSQLLIGSPFSPRSFSGLVDEIAFYPVALTSDQVSDRFNDLVLRSEGGAFARNDTLQVDEGEVVTLDSITDNDIAARTQAAGSAEFPIYVTHLNGIPVQPQSTIVLDSGSTILIDDSGSIAYAATETVGQDQSFLEAISYTIESGNSAPSSATITIQVDGTNDPPEALNDHFNLLESGHLNGNLFDDNGEGIDRDNDATDDIQVAGINGISLQQGPDFTFASGGQLSVQTDGSFSYTPADGFVGQDQFSYLITDQQGETDTASVTITVVSLAAPRVYYTDILSGPNIGGENDHGTYLSIFGVGFGESRGDSKVYINGVEVADYKYWGESQYGQQGIQQITIQPGSAVSSGRIVVEVDGFQSNDDHFFAVKPGNIYFVSLDGDDSTGAPNDISRPYRNAWYVLHDHGIGFAAGDSVVIREGSYTSVQGFGSGEYDYLNFYNKSGETDNPLMVIGYPGEHVQNHQPHPNPCWPPRLGHDRRAECRY